AVRPAPDGGDLVATPLRELDCQMTEPADALDAHQIARQGAAVTKGVEGRDARAHERRRLGWIERLRHFRHGFYRGDHVLLIAAVVADARRLRVRAVRKVAPPA